MSKSSRCTALVNIFHLVTREFGMIWGTIWGNNLVGSDYVAETNGLHANVHELKSQQSLSSVIPFPRGSNNFGTLVRIIREEIVLEQNRYMIASKSLVEVIGDSACGMTTRIKGEDDIYDLSSFWPGSKLTP